MVLPDMREIVMTHAGHGIWKCSCGQVVKQCRCPDKNKPVHIVQNGCDACHTMTTPTTQTAPLIERLTEAILELARLNGELDTPSVYDTVAEALGDVLVIEREQARETIIQAFMHTAVSPTGKGMDRKGAERRADELIAELAGEERP
jgi:hypothetical protein